MFFEVLILWAALEIKMSASAERPSSASRPIPMRFTDDKTEPYKRPSLIVPSVEVVAAVFAFAVISAVLYLYEAVALSVNIKFVRAPSRLILSNVMIVFWFVVYSRTSLTGLTSVSRMVSVP